MALYQVTLLPAAARALRKLDRPIQVQLVKSLETLASNPRPEGVKALTGRSGQLRVRSGDYRIIYTINDTELIVLIINVGHRREIYRSR